MEENFNLLVPENKKSKFSRASFSLKFAVIWPCRLSLRQKNSRGRVQNHTRVTFYSLFIQALMSCSG